MWVKCVSSYEGSKNNLLEFRDRMLEWNEVLESSHVDGEIRRVTSDSFKYVNLSLIKGKQTIGKHGFGNQVLYHAPELNLVEFKKPFAHEKKYSIISSSTGRRLYYATPDDEKNFGFVKKGIEYIEK